MPDRTFEKNLQNTGLGPSPHHLEVPVSASLSLSLASSSSSISSSPAVVRFGFQERAAPNGNVAVPFALELAPAPT